MISIINEVLTLQSSVLGYNPYIKRGNQILIKIQHAPLSVQSSLVVPEKLASKISYYEKELNKKIKIFIQINVGNENQKSGILINDLKKFYSYCINDLALNIVGLMCIPPINSDNSKYFKILKIKAQEFNLLELSIGMSSDYPQAIQYGATYLRLGTAIFGGRNN